MVGQADDDNVFLSINLDIVYTTRFILLRARYGVEFPIL